MRKNNIRITALAFAVLVVLSCSIRLQAQVEKAPYPAMAPLDQYLISDENVEIALVTPPRAGVRDRFRTGKSGWNFRELGVYTYFFGGWPEIFLGGYLYL